MDDEYNIDMMELLVTMALQCAEEDKDARPSITRVVESCFCPMKNDQ